ncbi:hypothetical protein AXF42_Ash019073 [Apostasia shenzhenica]|uniref:Uncharacterized protein n=1 Tax=Apostasia shenzhenica TaxID=1088818 RepID=A0A2I0BBA9_9ASPA|nr:hypothetical protein AXF42_Ash019073 [Apostasia shenzhenica]
MASSRFLLLLLLGLLVFAATAAAEISLPNHYILLKPFDDHDEKIIAGIANFGYQAYDYAQNSLARGLFLPQLIDKHWIAVGLLSDLSRKSLARRFCVIVKGDVFTGQIRVTAVARIKFQLHFSLSLAGWDINKRSIKVDKIEYHHI